jgi:imidazolonepropionase-like amidohydrolase
MLIFSSLSSLSQTNAFVLLHVNIVDMNSGRINENVNLKISGDEIVAISRSAKDIKNCRTIEAKGKYVIPGLWDMHVHIRNREDIFFPLLIANGVTGIRDMHNPARCFTAARWRDSINNSTAVAPRIGAVAGCIVDGPGDGRNYGFLVVNSEQEGRLIVDSLKNSGSDFIKVYDHLTPNVFMAIADECKKHNIPFAGHIPKNMDAIDCAAAGQKSFEHLENFHQYCSNKKTEILRFYRDSFLIAKDKDFDRIAQLEIDSFDSLITESLCTKLAAFGTYVDPTLVVDMTKKKKKELEYENVLSKKDIPAELAVWFESKKYVSGEDDLDEALFRDKLKIIRYLHRAKVKLLAGTDMSSIHRPVAGYSLHDELELYVANGLTPLEALRTATINPATFLNRDDKSGTVEKGKLADLVLLDADPVTDIKNTNKIFAVINKGKYLDKIALENLKVQAIKAVSKLNE